MRRVEEVAETAQAFEADFHTDLGHRMVALREQELGVIQPGPDTKLMGCEAENRFKLADKMERRNMYLPGHLLDRKTCAQQLTRLAQILDGVAGQSTSPSRSRSASLL